MSSPNINNVLLLGCILCYSVVFIKTIEVPNPAVCKVRAFIFCLGFTITFGALFAKTWRVYRIFTNKKLLKRTIKDSQLLAIISLLGDVVLVVLVLWEAVGPQEMIVRQLNDKFYTVGNDEEIRPFIKACYSKYSSQFGWVIYVMEGALLAFGAFLAWEYDVLVTIAALNDSHQIGLCLYNVVILSAVGLTLSLLLENQEVMLYAVTSACLIIGTTVTQFVVFAPKVHAVISKTDIQVRNKLHAPGQSTTVMAENTMTETKQRNGTVDDNEDEA